MLDMMIHVRDLLWAVFYILATGVGVLLVIFLVKAISVVKKVEAILTENREHVSDLLTLLPQSVHSMDEAAKSVKRTVDNVGDTMGYISDSVANKSAGIMANADGIIDVVKIVSEVLRAAMHYFGKKEDN